MKVLVDSSLAEVSVSEESEVVLCSLVFIRQRLLLSSDDTRKINKFIIPGKSVLSPLGESREGSITLTFFLIGFSSGDWNSTPSFRSTLISKHGSKVSAGDLSMLSSISEMDSILGSICSISCGSVFILRRYFLFCFDMFGVSFSKSTDGSAAEVGEGYVIASGCCC